MRVEQLMHQPAVTCHLADDARQAAKLMWDHDCGLVVVVGNDGSIAGVITDRDICMAALMRAQPLSAIAVRDAMATEIYSCRPNDAITLVEQLMMHKQVRRIPVVDSENKPVGMLTLNDIARTASAVRRNRDAEHAVVEVLLAVSKPRQGAIQRA